MFEIVTGIAQIALTLIAAYLAYQAHRFSQKTSKLNFIIATTNILNGINTTSISTEQNIDALQRLRPSVSGDPHKDYIALMNLNYLQTIWSLREERVIGPALANAKLQNGIGFLLDSSEDYVKGLLGRGFPKEFQAEMLRYYEKSRTGHE
ncbi:MAG: hypothetical protein HRT81_05520 [Henriciella sp.]|nr:hypothetical protein [Henriciella sp.]